MTDLKQPRISEETDKFIEFEIPEGKREEYDLPESCFKSGDGQDNKNPPNYFEYFIKNKSCGDSVIVAQQTLQFVGSGSNPTSPHHIHLKEIKAQIASQLNERWHSRLPKIHWSNIVRNTHYVCYGLYHKSEAIGVAIWSSPVAQNRFKDGKQMLELRRLALSERCPKNTASRCIGIMVKLVKKKFPEITRLISYQDTAVHNGTIYKASNWSNEAETDFASWTTNKRQRNKDQATGKKIRWEWKYATFQRSTTRKPIKAK